MTIISRKEKFSKQVSSSAQFKISLVTMEKVKNGKTHKERGVEFSATGNPPSKDEEYIEIQDVYSDKANRWDHAVWIKKDMHDLFLKNYLIVANKASWKTTHRLFESDQNLSVDDHNKKIIFDNLLAKGYSNEFWDLINDSDPELADKLSAGHLQLKRKQIINELIERLNPANKFSETIGNDSWQKWIYKNSWILGSNYQKPIEKQKINLRGIMPDYLFPTVDGFIDILEIKIPDMEVIIEDKNHLGSWAWSSDSNKAIGQVVNYLSEIDRLKLEIESCIRSQNDGDPSCLKPRAIIVIGKNNNWNRNKKEGLRKLNSALHGIEIITYSDLVTRGKIYTQEPNY